MGFTGLDGVYAPFTRETHRFFQKATYGRALKLHMFLEDSPHMSFYPAKSFKLFAGGSTAPKLFWDGRTQLRGNVGQTAGGLLHCGLADLHLRLHRPGVSGRVREVA